MDMPAKRALDLAACFLLLPVVAPLMVAIAITVLVTSGRPILYSAKRMGHHGEVFALLKFRTMRTGMTGPAVTRADDPRVTRIGRVLRRTKLDEIPSLLNVLRGHMSLVGPRPEDPRYLPYYSAEEREVLSVRPGITGPTALRFRDEEQLFCRLPAEQLEHLYSSEYLHEKLRLDLAYLRSRSLVTDLVVLRRTVLVPLRRHRPDRHRTDLEGKLAHTAHSLPGPPAEGPRHSRGSAEGLPNRARPGPGARHWRSRGRHRLGSRAASASLAPPKKMSLRRRAERSVVSAMLGTTELKERASAGVVIVATRSLVVLVIGFGGTVVIARLLTPHDLGVVAIGMSFVLFTGLISDGGLGAGLIRRVDPPSRAELRALSALQLSVTTAVALVGLALAALFGVTGWVTAIMVSSMPFVALQFPGRILLERSLLYREVAFVEISQVLCYHTWNIATVLAGFGVWGLATGAIVRAAVGAIAMAVVMPAGNVRPAFDLATIRPLVGFGMRFQAVNATMLVRDQLLNLAVAAVAGVTTLGEWSLVRKIMEVPWLLFYSLSRVSLPAVPQLLAAGREPKPLVERAVALTAVGAGLLLAAVAGGAPGLVPGVFGDQWSSASGAVALSCLAVGVTGCVTSVKSYLFAVDGVSAVLRAGLVMAAVWFAVSMTLLPFVGVTAVGIGWVAASIAEAVVLARESHRRATIRLLPPLVVPVSVGVLSATAGWAVSVHLGRDLLSGVAGGAVAVALFTVGLLLFRRSVVIDTMNFAARSLRLAATAGPRRSKLAEDW